MAKTKKSAEPNPKRVRPRPNAVMVDMDDEIRAMLEAVRDDLAREARGQTVTLASTVRQLVVDRFKGRNLKLKAR